MTKFSYKKQLQVCNDLEQAARQNFYFGAKLVRGAYIEQERARAAALGYEDPTNPTFEATTEMYHKTLTECLRRIKKLKDAGVDPKKIAIMVASHNEDTVRFAIEKMKEIGISPEDKVICFGQLLGMCDYITMPLGKVFLPQIQSNISNLFYVQVNLVIRPTNIFLTVQLTKFCHICHDELKKTKAC